MTKVYFWNDENIFTRTADWSDVSKLPLQATLDPIPAGLYPPILRQDDKWVGSDAAQFAQANPVEKTQPTLGQQAAANLAAQMLNDKLETQGNIATMAATILTTSLKGDL